MSAPDWIATLRQLHAAAKSRKLTPEEDADYAQAKEAFARAMVAAQGLPLPAGESARASFRVGVLMQLEIKHGPRTLRTATLDISVGGFSTVSDLAITTGEMVEITLSLGNGETLMAAAKMVGKQVRDRGLRLSFAFSELTPANHARLEIFLFDQALARIPA